MRINGSVIVITGASSGIGRATALHCAEQGAKVVIAARREDALEEVAVECREAGGAALAVGLEASDASSMHALAEAAIERFGQIDVWVNNAGAYAVGHFEDTPAETFDRILAVNLAGVVNGSREALAAFRTRERGVLVNVSSMVAGLAGPWVSAYATSKWGVRGFTHALHEELRDAPDIHACVVRPAGIDTPIFRHAANYSGTQLKALTPTYPPEQAARTIARLIERPRREVVVGTSGRALVLAHAIAPLLTDHVFGIRASRNQFVPGTHADRTDGNVFVPDPGWTTTSGGWPTVDRRRSVVAAPLLAGAAAALALARARTRRAPR
jgi:NAD(P)-dependent dehydrogenase (short-subunit alcohol dehydrogenase family)